jgi:hypothetical protein
MAGGNTSQGSANAQPGSRGGNFNNGGVDNGQFYGGSAYRGDGSAVSGRLTPEEIRQFRNEFRQNEADLQALRRQMGEAGVNARDIDDIMRDLRAFNTDAAFADPRNLAALQAAALDKLKKVEFNLRKQAEGSSQPLSLSGSDEVPASFRSAIEEYYRSIANKRNDPNASRNLAK